MSPTGVTRLLVTANVVVLGIGVIDAAITGEWDLLTVLLIGLAISTVLLVRLEARRPAVPIRRDLALWLRERAAISGESLDTVTDRAVSTFADRYGALVDAKETRQ